MIDEWTEFDFFYGDEPEKEREKRAKEDDLSEGHPTAITLDRETLTSLTKRAIAEEEAKRTNAVTEDQKAEIASSAREIAYNILEWVYLSAEAGEWSYVYDMTKLPRTHLMPTVLEVKSHFLDTYVRYCDTEANRWIEVSWLRQK